VWTTALSFVSKLVTMGSQVVVAWFVLPREIGLAALTLSVASIASTVSSFHLSRVLIQRREWNEADVSQAFWLSLAMNLFGALVLALMAPGAASLFGEPQLRPMIWVVAAAVFFQALPTIYSTALYRQLRFRSVALIHLGQSVLLNGLTILLAILGFGVYALVLPLVVSALYLGAVCRLAAGRIPLGRPCPEQWPRLLTPAAWLMGVAGCTALQGYGSNFVIGLAHDPTVAGIYYWSFSLSGQAVFLLVSKLQDVLFPALSRLNGDPERQGVAFKKICEALTLATVPVCVLQVLLARPGIELLFHERWEAAIPVVQWLSLGMLTQPLGMMASSFLLARGCYRRLAALTAGVALAVTGAAAIGAHFGQAAVIARWTGMSLLLTNLVAGAVTLRQFDLRWRSRFFESTVPLLAVIPCFCVGWLVECLVGAPALVMMGMVCLGVGAVYALLVWWFWPEVGRELAGKLGWARRSREMAIPPYAQSPPANAL
jgi:O-antigen/teichoic acid export membrane protein